MTADLCGEAAVFADAGAFWEAQEAAVGEKADGYRARGWADVVRLERGAYFHRWDYVQTSKKQGGKVFVEQRYDGTVTFHEGWLTASEARRAKTASATGTKGADMGLRPEMSGPMADYIGLHRHGAAQVSLTRNPAIALRLMAAHALCGTALWTVRPHAPGAVKDATLASLEGSPAAAQLGTAQAEVEALFEALGAPVPRQNGDGHHLCEIFAALLAMSDAEVLQVMAWVMAQTLEPGGAAVEAVLHVCGTDLGAFWQPDEAFWDLLRDKRVINAMIADIASPALAECCREETAKAQKTILANRVSGEGCSPEPCWRPGWMQVPPARHVDGAACAPVEAWDRIAGLFEADEDGNSGTGPAACDPPAA